MAAFSGAIVERSRSVAWAGLSPTLPPTEGLVVGPRHPMLPESWLSGTFSTNLPIAFLTEGYAGTISASFFDDYYNRIWLLPSVVAFGSLTSTTSVPIVIWNTHNTPVTLESVGAFGDSSLSLSALPIPLELKPLASFQFTLTADVEGDPDIDAQIGFDFTPIEQVSLLVTGNRSRIWEFPPNWSSPLEISLEYKTEIITSRDGSEQRIADRQTPRKSMSFEAVANDAAFRSFVRFMNARQNLSTIMPEFNRGAHLAALAVPGATLLSLEETPNWIMVDQLVVLYEGGTNGNRSEVRRIVEFAANTITLNAPLSGEWTVGSRIYPAVIGRIADQISVSQRGNRTSVIAVRFDVDPGSEHQPPDGSPAVTHLGREVFMKRPNWSSSPSPEFRAVLEQVDYSIGRVSNFTPVSFNDRYQKANFVALDRGEAEDLMAFFRRHFGQAKEFFMPTYTEDLRISDMIYADTTTMRVEGREVAADFGDLEVFRDFVLFLDDGTHLMRHVTSITAAVDPDEQDSVIQVSEPWPADISEDSIVQICWMPLWRLASDGMTFSWLTDQAAETALTMKTLPYNDAES